MAAAFTWSFGRSRVHRLCLCAPVRKKIAQKFEFGKYTRTVLKEVSLARFGEDT